MWINRRYRSYPAGIRNIASKHLPDHELEDFAFWAFGDDYMTFDKTEGFVNAWNKHHKDIYKIDMSNEISYDIGIMCELWVENGKPMSYD